MVRNSPLRRISQIQHCRVMLKALLICIQDYRQTPNRLLVIFFECDIEKSLQGVARLHLKDVPTSNFSGVQNLYTPNRLG